MTMFLLERHRRASAIILLSCLLFCSALLSQQVRLVGYSTNVGSAALLMMSSTSDVPTDSPRALVSKGMERFKEGDVRGSIELFDAADHATGGRLRPYLWQRGISYYYADEFQNGSNQFRYDVSVNPLDVEEIVWDIACLSRLNPSPFPPKNMLSLPSGKKDRRKIMETVYSLFRGEATEEDLARAGHSGSSADEFYSLLYLGLFCESRGEAAKAAGYMKTAVLSSYARGSGASDYMTSVAKVHCRLRGWS